MLRQRSKKDAALTEAKRRSGKLAVLPTLKLTRNETVLQELSFDVPQLLIGRTEDNDISIPSSYVSRHHILLFRNSDSTILVDLNSKNGTFVNLKRVYNYKLAHDDVISMDLHSKFVSYRIQYSDPSMAVHGTSQEIDPKDAVIAKALTSFGSLLAKGDTYLLPTLSEDVPTVVGFVDDR